MFDEDLTEFTAAASKNSSKRRKIASKRDQDDNGSPASFESNMGVDITSPHSSEKSNSLKDPRDNNSKTRSSPSRENDKENSLSTNIVNSKKKHFGETRNLETDEDFSAAESETLLEEVESDTQPNVKSLLTKIKRLEKRVALQERQNYKSRNEVQPCPFFQTNEIKLCDSAGKRFLVLNQHGYIQTIYGSDVSRRHSALSHFHASDGDTLEVFRTDCKSGKAVQRFPNPKAYDIGSLDDHGFALARKLKWDSNYGDTIQASDTYSQPLFEYHSFEYWGSKEKSFWVKSLPFNEEIITICVGQYCVALISQIRLVRIFSTKGLLLHMFIVEGIPVAIVAKDAYLFTLSLVNDRQTYSTPSSCSDDLAYKYNYTNIITNSLISQGSIHMSKASDGCINWAAISDYYFPVIVTEKGQCLGLLPMFGVNCSQLPSSCSSFYCLVSHAKNKGIDHRFHDQFETDKVPLIANGDPRIISAPHASRNNYFWLHLLSLDDAIDNHSSNVTYRPFHAASGWLEVIEDKTTSTQTSECSSVRYPVKPILLPYFPPLAVSREGEDPVCIEEMSNQFQESSYRKLKNAFNDKLKSKDDADLDIDQLSGIHLLQECMIKNLVILKEQINYSLSINANLIGNRFTIASKSQARSNLSMTAAQKRHLSTDYGSVFLGASTTTGSKPLFSCATGIGIDSLFDNAEPMDEAMSVGDKIDEVIYRLEHSNDCNLLKMFLKSMDTNRVELAFEVILKMRFYRTFKHSWDHLGKTKNTILLAKLKEVVDKLREFEVEAVRNDINPDMNIRNLSILTVFDIETKLPPVKSTNLRNRYTRMNTETGKRMISTKLAVQILLSNRDRLERLQEQSEEVNDRENRN